MGQPQSNSSSLDTNKSKYLSELQEILTKLTANKILCQGKQVSYHEQITKLNAIKDSLDANYTVLFLPNSSSTGAELVEEYINTSQAQVDQKLVHLQESSSCNNLTTIEDTEIEETSLPGSEHPQKRRNLNLQLNQDGGRPAGLALRQSQSHSLIKKVIKVDMNCDSYESQINDMADAVDPTHFESDDGSFKFYSSCSSIRTSTAWREKQLRKFFPTTLASSGPSVEFYYFEDKSMQASYNILVGPETPSSMSNCATIYEQLIKKNLVQFILLTFSINFPVYRIRDDVETTIRQAASSGKPYVSVVTDCSNDVTKMTDYVISLTHKIDKVVIGNHQKSGVPKIFRLSEEYILNRRLLLKSSVSVCASEAVENDFLAEKEKLFKMIEKGNYESVKALFKDVRIQLTDILSHIQSNLKIKNEVTQGRSILQKVKSTIIRPDKKFKKSNYAIDNIELNAVSRKVICQLRKHYSEKNKNFKDFGSNHQERLKDFNKIYDRVEKLEKKAIKHANLLDQDSASKADTMASRIQTIQSRRKTWSKSYCDNATARY